MTVQYVKKDTATSLNVIDITVDAGTNFLIVQTQGEPCSGVTFNDVDMDELYNVDMPTNTGDSCCWVMLNPPVGTYELELNWGGSGTKTCFVSHYSGVVDYDYTFHIERVTSTKTQARMGTALRDGYVHSAYHAYTANPSTTLGDWTYIGNSVNSYGRIYCYNKSLTEGEGSIFMDITGSTYLASLIVMYDKLIPSSIDFVDRVWQRTLITDDTGGRWSVPISGRGPKGGLLTIDMAISSTTHPTQVVLEGHDIDFTHIYSRRHLDLWAMPNPPSDDGLSTWIDMDISSNYVCLTVSLWQGVKYLDNVVGYAGTPPSTEVNPGNASMKNGILRSGLYGKVSRTSPSGFTQIVDQSTSYSAQRLVERDISEFGESLSHVWGMGTQDSSDIIAYAIYPFPKDDVKPIPIFY
jgi:hypothetical protein